MKIPRPSRRTLVLSVLLLAAVGAYVLLKLSAPGPDRRPPTPATVAQAPPSPALPPESDPGPDTAPEAVEKSPDADGAAEAQALRLNNLGIAEMEQFHFDRAAERFAAARELRPDLTEAAVNLGIALYYDRKREDSMRTLRAVIAGNPGQVNARYVLALMERETGRNNEALEHLGRVLGQDPVDPTANYLAGSLEANLKKWDRAIARFETALSADPWNTSVLYALAKTLIQKGDTPAAEKAMARFQELRQSGSATSFGNLYLEQGRYARAMESPVDRTDRHGLTSRPVFVETAESSGIRFVHAGPHSLPPALPVDTISPASVAAYGSGGAFFDLDGDGWPDICLANASESGDAEPVLFRNMRDGSFRLAGNAGLDFRGIGMGVAAGDYDHDGRTDLFLTGAGRNALYHNEGNGKFREATEILGPAPAEGTWGLSAAFFDYDHDGDLDLFVSSPGRLTREDETTSSPLHLRFVAGRSLQFRNNGDGTFSETAEAAGIPGGVRATSVTILDYNNSRDIDLLLVGDRSGLLSNNRNGTYADVTAGAGLGSLGLPWGVAVGDFDGDGLMDVCAPAPGEQGIVDLFWNEGGRFRRSAVRVALPAQFRSAAAFDYDNDGDPDILLLSDKLALLENQSARKFLDVSRAAGLDRIRATNSRSAAIADLDRDGDLDVLVTRSGAAPLLLRNEGGTRNKALRLSLEGKADNREGIGAKVQWAAGGLWQHLEHNGSLGYLSQSSGDLLLGLGRNASPDYVRVLWPTGVLQTEAPGKEVRRLELVELDRKGTSCPILYAWDGKEYRFVTDFLGGSATGYLVGPGRYAVPDSDEYVKIGSDRLRPRGDLLSLKMVNQLEEVILFDAVQLIAVDHPGEFEVFPNERLLTAPPFPGFGIVTAGAARPVVSATDGKGQDWTRQLEAPDRKYVTGFGLLPWKGYAEEHSLVLDLGDLRDAKRTVLLLDGWIDYASSSSNFAAAQAGLKLIPPYLQVRESSGEWRTILADMGFPAGLPKTMVVDLTGRVPRSRSTSIRIVTNMRIYWDSIRLETGEQDPRVRTTALVPARASLDWVGYPRAWSPDVMAPFHYDYSRREARAPWKSHEGRYTRYGDVRSTLAEVDDQYVVLAHGDGVTAEFLSRDLPDVAEGWTRDWLLYVDGFGKDMDLHSEHPDAVEPLPRHRELGYRRSGWIALADEVWNGFRRRYLSRRNSW